MTAPALPAPPPSRIGDRVFGGALRAIAGLVLLLPIAMLAALFAGASASTGRGVLGALAGAGWDPERGRFGAWALVGGTAVTSAIALCLAVPVALGLAVFLSDLAPHAVRRPLGLGVELLASVPSVVYGLWGIFVLVPFVSGALGPLAHAPSAAPGLPLGVGVLAASLVLAVMIMPTITSVARDVLRAVPDAHREAALGLGAQPWDVVRVAVLPSARWGLLGAVVLGWSRAIGEAMAVAIVLGSPLASASPGPRRATMASVVADELGGALSGEHTAVLSAIALVLLSVTLAASLLGRALVEAATRRMARAA